MNLLNRPMVVVALLVMSGFFANPIDAADADSSVAARFVGNYELLSFVFFGQDGEIRPQNTIGRIMYDANGNMAAQLMPKDYAQESSEGQQDNRRGYTAYFGTYTIDPENKTVTHHVIGSTNRNWVGTDLKRYYGFVDGDLTLSLKRGERTVGTLRWKRL